MIHYSTSSGVGIWSGLFLPQVEHPASVEQELYVLGSYAQEILH